jgi:hypothetical protein
MLSTPLFAVAGTDEELIAPWVMASNVVTQADEGTDDSDFDEDDFDDDFDDDFEEEEDFEDDLPDELDDKDLDRV